MHARAVLLLALLASACSRDEPAGPAPLPPLVRLPGEPDQVVYYQILVSFRGAARGPGAARTQAEARTLVRDLEGRLRRRENFFGLMHRWSDDRVPGSAQANGPYVACNLGVAAKLREDRIPEIPRENLERGVGDALFRMGIGEARVVPYDARTCAWGWHILHRVR